MRVTVTELGLIVSDGQLELRIARADLQSWENLCFMVATRKGCPPETLPGKLVDTLYPDVEPGDLADHHRDTT